MVETAIRIVEQENPKTKSKSIIVDDPKAKLRAR
jgi:hypothetical protein